MQYDSYTWFGGYATSGFDNSDPPSSALPDLISDTSRGDPGSAVDVHFENFTLTPFTSGTLVTFDLTVPSDFAFGQVTISAVPDTIAGDAGDIVTTAGPPFTLDVVPEPTTFMLFAAGFAMFARRPKRKVAGAAG